MLQANQTGDLGGAMGGPATRAGAVGASHAALARALVELARREGWAVGLKSVDDGRYLWSNAALAALIGRGGDGLEGRRDTELLGADAGAALEAADRAAAAQTHATATEHHLAARSADGADAAPGGAPAAVATHLVVRVPDGAGRLVTVWQDQAPQREMRERLHHAVERVEQLHASNEALRQELASQGLRDAASGLATAAHFDEQLRRELDLSQREHREFALVHLEIDPLAPAARALGEPRVRERLRDTMGALLRGNTRAMDASCRSGDLRFALLLSGVGLATAHSRMESLRRQCATQIVLLDGERLAWSVSMGVASFPHTVGTLPALRDACDTALGEARRRGGNAVVLAAIRFGDA